VDQLDPKKEHLQPHVLKASLAVPLAPQACVVLVAAYDAVMYQMNLLPYVGGCQRQSHAEQVVPQTAPQMGRPHAA
jgi:hypothetical protein